PADGPARGRCPLGRAPRLGGQRVRLEARTRRAAARDSRARLPGLRYDDHGHGRPDPLPRADRPHEPRRRAPVRKLIVVLTLCVISSLALVAQGTPPDSTSDSTTQLLQQAHALYERLDLERAVPLLERVLSPGWSFGMTKAQRVDAY